MAGAAGLANRNYCRPHLVKNFLGIAGAKSLDGLIFQREECHEVLSELPKDFRVLLATNTLVILEDALGETRLTQFNITDQCEFGNLAPDRIELLTPVAVFEFSHNEFF